MVDTPRGRHDVGFVGHRGVVSESGDYLLDVDRFHVAERVFTGGSNARVYCFGNFTARFDRWEFERNSTSDRFPEFCAQNVVSWFETKIKPLAESTYVIW
jgi:hypothetical protein